MAGTLDERLADWEARLDRLEGDLPVDYVVFMPSPSGYELVDARGRLPEAGMALEAAERNGGFRVLRVNGSPLPGDERRVVYVEAI